MKCKLLKDMHTQRGIDVPAGTEVEVTVPKEHPTIAILEIGEHKIRSRSASLYTKFAEFQEFTMDDMQEAVGDGTSPSLTGDIVELDGWDSEGFPSILLAMGLI
jgi:hypothetical protein